MTLSRNATAVTLRIVVQGHCRRLQPPPNPSGMRPVNDVTGSGLSVMRADGSYGHRLSAIAQARSSRVSCVRTRGFAFYSPIEADRESRLPSCSAARSLRGGMNAWQPTPSRLCGITCRGRRQHHATRWASHRECFGLGGATQRSLRREPRDTVPHCSPASCLSSIFTDSAPPRGPPGVRGSGLRAPADAQKNQNASRLRFPDRCRWDTGRRALRHGSTPVRGPQN